MRNLFLALLLANILLVAWQFWSTPPAVDPFALHGEKAVRDLRLYPAAAGARPAAPRPGAPAPGMGQILRGAGCFRIGPFPETAGAEAVRKSLGPAGVEGRVSTDEGQVWVGHWVQLEKLGDRAVAEGAVARLGAAGVPEAYVVEASPPFSVSLGVFRERDRADKVAGIARGLGYTPVVTDRFRSGTQFWVGIALAAGQSLDLGRLGLDPGQIARAEPASCVAPAEGSP
jgi:hypothetical protein